MQCPNCGKEAINVNGKFVCLDCGIEITPASASPSVPAEPPIINHNPVFASEPDAASAPTQPETSNIPVEPQTPVRDIYEEALKGAEPKDNGSYDFDASKTDDKTTESPLETPTTISSNQSTSDVNSEPTATLVTPITPEAENEQPKPTSIVENQLEVNQSAPENPSLQVATEEQIQATQTEVSETPAPSVPNQVEPELPPITEPKDFESPAPAVENPFPGSPASNLQPESFFQPSTVDITGGENNNISSLSNPISDLEPTSEASQVPVARNLNESETPAIGSNLDDLLDQVAPASAPTMPTSAPAFSNPSPNMSVDTMMPVNQTPVPTAASATNQSPSMPGVSNIPSAESVFGNNPAPVAQTKSGFNKKIIIIIAAVLGGIILIVGLIAGIAAFSSPKKTSTELNQEKMFAISDAVSGVMDDALDAEVNFNQTVDFSAATVNETLADGSATPNLEELKGLVGKSIAKKGFWRVNSDGDIYLDETVGSEINKRVYKAAEKNTYVFSQASNSWTKSAGFSVNNVPNFYSVQNRGSLFYLTKINSIEEKGKEEIEGALSTKLRIVPKIDLIQGFLSEVSLLLATNSYEEVVVDNLEVYAWISGENKITKVTVSGDIGIKSDLYNGTVSVNSEASYIYKNVDIPKL